MGGLEHMDAVQAVQGHPAACRQPHRQHEQALVGLQGQSGGQRLHHLPQGGELERERRGASPCPQSGDESRECGEGVLRSSSPALGGGAAGGGERQEGVCRAVCRRANRAAEENHRGDAHQQDRVCRVHQVSGASSDEGGRRRSRRLENCSSHCCRCCCLRRQNINIKEKKSRMTSFQIIFLSNSCRCLRKQSINIKNQKSRMTSSQIIFGNFCCCSRRPGINKEMDANNHKWINGPP